MRLDVNRDLSRSSRVFVEIVWPAIAPILGEDSRYVPVEGAMNRDIVRDLDTHAGIDGFQVGDSLGVMRGVATRVQWIRPGMTPYNTFTVRVKRPSGSMTEKDKRIRAILNDGYGILYPNLTIQAYLRDQSDDLLSVGVVLTKDLFTCVQKHPSGQFKYAGNGGEKFEIYPFNYLQKHGYRVQVWEKQTGRLLINGQDARAA